MSFHSGQTFTFGETPSATKWNYLWENDYALADGTGISDAAIINRHLSTTAVKVGNIDFSTWPSVTAYLVNDQNSTNGVSLINLDTEEHDQASNFSTSTHLFTAPATGKYLITGSVYLITSTGRNTPVIYKNGSAYLEPATDAGAFQSKSLAIILSLTASDTIGLGVRSDGVYAINSPGITGSDISTFLSVVRIA